MSETAELLLTLLKAKFPLWKWNGCSFCRGVIGIRGGLKGLSGEVWIGPNDHHYGYKAGTAQIIFFDLYRSVTCSTTPSFSLRKVRHSVSLFIIKEARRRAPYRSKDARILLASIRSEQ